MTCGMTFWDAVAPHMGAMLAGGFALILTVVLCTFLVILEHYHG